MKLLSGNKQNTFLRASLYDKCNFSCQYCAVDVGMENHTPKCISAPLLTAEEYLHNMRLLAAHGFRNISYTGGEPLLNPDFPRIAKGCRELFDTIEITTNGTRLLEHIDVIKKYIDVLKISIDSTTPTLAAKIAGNPSAANTPEIIEKCCRSGIKTIGFNFVYMQQNKDELWKLIDFSADLKRKYNTDIYISILDLYFSAAKKEFWQKQFVNLAELRKQLLLEGKVLNHRLRFGCDSYNYICKGVLVNMKDSISCTHRADICNECDTYCQEGIYSLKHSASGWISACPSNDLKLGNLLNSKNTESQAHTLIDKYIEIINQSKRVENTGESFFQYHNLEVSHD